MLRELRAARASANGRWASLTGRSARARVRPESFEVTRSVLVVGSCTILHDIDNDGSDRHTLLLRSGPAILMVRRFAAITRPPPRWSRWEIERLWRTLHSFWMSFRFLPACASRVGAVPRFDGALIDGDVPSDQALLPRRVPDRRGVRTRLRSHAHLGIDVHLERLPVEAAAAWRRDLDDPDVVEDAQGRVEVRVLPGRHKLRMADRVGVARPVPKVGNTVKPSRSRPAPTRTPAETGCCFPCEYADGDPPRVRQDRPAAHDTCCRHPAEA